MTPSGLVVLTDRQHEVSQLLSVVAAAVRGGAAWVVLRERDLPNAQRRALAAEMRELVPTGRLIVAGPDPLNADAVHLAEADPQPDVPVRMIGRSCHGRQPKSDVDGSAVSVVHRSAGGLHRNDRVPRRRADYVTLSPIYPTVTKPGYGPPLGPEGAAALAGSIPWLALGGIDSPERAAACAAAGARGIAVLGAVMRATDPEAVCRSLANAFEASAPACRGAVPGRGGGSSGCAGRSVVAQ